MNGKNRYPGAQPFSDTELSRRTFFGREQASLALTNQILANRLVVVYAKSGLGKSSLLNAGVAPLLREAGTIPLFVRVNDVKRDLLVSIPERIEEEAKRQDVEFVPGDNVSLWSFFKTAEFWKRDLLQVPVLIFDQFEELFTLQTSAVREKFLSELGSIVRGVPPVHQQQNSEITGSPPQLHVVLSLREDFLGILEEGAEHIPQILDHRFRLTPLSRDTAAQAMMLPAAVDDPALATKPFRLEDDLVTGILHHLAKIPAGSGTSALSHIEPFHLQLICQRVETLAASKQRLDDEVVVTLTDFGGESAIGQTLVGFYNESVRSIPERHIRSAVRRMCEEYLISPEGRRLSVEERELRRQLKLTPDILRRLVDARLLRTERRSNSTYYELGHDALVEPVLANKRTQALFLAWSGVLGGSFILAIAVLVELFLLLALIDDALKGQKKDLAIAVFVVVFLSGPIVWLAVLGAKWARSGIRRRARYRKHTPTEAVEEFPTLLPLPTRIGGWILVVVGGISALLWSFFGLLLGLAIIWIGLLKAQGPPFLRLVSPLILKPSFREVFWLGIEIWAPILLSWIICRSGLKILGLLQWGKNKTTPERLSTRLIKIAEILMGAGALVLAFATLIAFRRCVVNGAVIPAWFPGHIQNLCQKVAMLGWQSLGFEGVLFLFSPWAIGLGLLLPKAFKGSTRLRIPGIKALGS
jgi:hypothetical protein